jgi:hypothetical protein
MPVAKLKRSAVYQLQACVFAITLLSNHVGAQGKNFSVVDGFPV